MGIYQCVADNGLEMIQSSAEFYAGGMCSWVEFTIPRGFIEGGGGGASASKPFLVYPKNYISVLFLKKALWLHPISLVPPSFKRFRSQNRPQFMNNLRFLGLPMPIYSLTVVKVCSDCFKKS